MISRQIIRSGALARYIDDDGITGVTANPTIFEKAIVGTHDYDDTIRAFGGKGCTSIQIYDDDWPDEKYCDGAARLHSWVPLHRVI